MAHIGVVFSKVQGVLFDICNSSRIVLQWWGAYGSSSGLYSQRWFLEHFFSFLHHYHMGARWVSWVLVVCDLGVLVEFLILE